MRSNWNKKHKGITLIETIVAVGIFGAVVSGMTLLFYVGWNSQRYQLNLGRASMLADRGVSKVIKEVRQAQQGADGSFPIASGDDFDIVFYSDVDADGVVERVHYSLVSGDFKRGITDAVGNPLAYPSSDDSTTVISTSVVNTSSEYIFTYYDGSGNVLTTPVTTNQVRMVRVSLLVDVDPYTSPEPVIVESISTMRNLVNN